jgi:AhpD family alkylhydroperoxidase
MRDSVEAPGCYLSRAVIASITSEVIGALSSRAYSVVVARFNLIRAHHRGHIMSAFQIHSIDSAPEQSKPVLRELQAAFGLVPNIAGAMAGSPVLINSFIGLFQRVHAGSFTEAQIQTLLLTNAVTNACSWAIAFHTALALKEGLSSGDVEAIREGRAPADPKHAALLTLTRTLIEKRGNIGDHDIGRFVEAGFRQDQVLEMLAVLAASTMTNYAGNITTPPVEAPFDAYRWNA